MSEILQFLPFLFSCTLFFVFLTLGLGLLITSRDTVLERFGQLYFNLTNRSYEEDNDISESVVISISRAMGGICLTLSALGAWMIVARFFEA